MNGKENEFNNEKKNKKHAKLPNVLEPGYAAPDGGWGWMVVIATGFSNFFTLSILLSFGLMFQDRFHQLGISIAQTTTIVNVNIAVMSCIGLINGPLFRKYSCRQVSCFGALLSAFSICALSFMETFYGILISLAIFYAIGNSLCMCSCALSLNIYFKKKRRTAVCLSWTCTGLAAIIIPQVVTLLVPIYDVSGTVLLFGGIMFNAFACALLLQPISRHARKESACEGLEAQKMDNIKEKDSMVCRTLLKGSTETPPVAKICNRGELVSNEQPMIDDYKIRSTADSTTQSLLGPGASMRHIRKDKEDENQTWYMRAMHTVGVFFDLDLLRDPIYVNIMIGLTLVDFADLNSFMLLPFILSDNLPQKSDVANIMSLLAIVDVITRLTIPFIATAIGWENRSFYMVAMTILATSRILLAYVKTYDLLMATAIIVGAGKAFRQVFISLVIPTHVPLDRLAAATGLQRTAGGITFLAFGPMVGWIRDICGTYTISMHFLNCFTYLVIISWLVEFSYISMKKKRMDETKETACPKE